MLDNEVDFLVVDAYAMAAFGYPRATGDFDLWVLISVDNSEKIYNSLAQFGAPLEQINRNTFCEEGIVFQIGVVPRRIDIIIKIDGVDFKQAYANRKEILIDDLNIPFISKEDLIKNKEATGR